MAPLVESSLPLPLLRRGKVREVYEVDADRLLLVASDRVSAFDGVMAEAVPDKGRVLTQLSAHWFRQLANVTPSHFITADTTEIIAAVPALREHRQQIDGRATLVKRTNPAAFECVVRGYLAGSAWGEYHRSGTLAGEPLPAGLQESSKLESPLFSPATKAESGHDENVPYARMRQELGPALADTLRDRSLALYAAGRDLAAQHGIIIADTKFEFGTDAAGRAILIDEILTPDSSRFWPAASYAPGRSQPSFDKQPLRDWLAHERESGRWDGNAPGPALPDSVIAATSERYREAHRLLVGRELGEEQ
ncbi:MAG: phosphoribosylaminoimidazolesuccinocarboxamide synthase [Gemmatimonadota bacterium]